MPHFASLGKSPTCHPDLSYFADNLCKRCYNARQKHGPERFHVSSVRHKAVEPPLPMPRLRCICDHPSPYEDGPLIACRICSRRV